MYDWIVDVGNESDPDSSIVPRISEIQALGQPGLAVYSLSRRIACISTHQIDDERHKHEYFKILLGNRSCSGRGGRNKPGGARDAELAEPRFILSLSP